MEDKGDFTKRGKTRREIRCRGHLEPIKDEFEVGKFYLCPKVEYTKGSWNTKG